MLQAQEIPITDHLISSFRDQNESYQKRKRSQEIICAYKKCMKENLLLIFEHLPFCALSRPEFALQR